LGLDGGITFFFFFNRKMIEALLRAHPHLDFLMANAICSAYEAGTLDEILSKSDEEKNSQNKQTEADEGGSDKVPVH
jgi:hypothetical protein